MYQMGDKGATYASFPSNMQSLEVWAFGVQWIGS